MTIPEEKSLAPINCKHGTDFGGAEVELGSGLSYELADAAGSKVTSGAVSLNASTGLLKVNAGASAGTYTAKLMYNGNVFKEVPITVTADKRDSFWTEDFEGSSHKFTKISGTDYWQEDKATKNNDSGNQYK